MASVSLRLPDDIAARLKQLAELISRSKKFYMVETINLYIDDLDPGTYTQARALVLG